MPITQKPFLTYDEQIALLEQRGLIFSDKTKAKRFLRHIGYSHLKAYWLSVPDETDFGEVIRLYRFDAGLKALLTRAMTAIELSLRHAWIICLSDSKKGCHPLSYLDKAFYQDFAKSEQYFRELVTDSRISFISKYKNTKSMPPIWKTAELMSFGGLSQTTRANFVPQTREVSQSRRIKRQPEHNGGRASPAL